MIGLTTRVERVASALSRWTRRTRSGGVEKGASQTPTMSRGRGEEVWRLDSGTCWIFCLSWRTDGEEL